MVFISMFRIESLFNTSPIQIVEIVFNESINYVAHCELINWKWAFEIDFPIDTGPSNENSPKFDVALINQYSQKVTR